MLKVYRFCEVGLLSVKGLKEASFNAQVLKDSVKNSFKRLKD